jgi:uncharacterized protein (DUF58 family)
MIRRAPLLLALSSLTGWCLFLAIALDRQEFLMVAIPLMGALLSTRSSVVPAHIQTALEASPVRVCEGDLLTVTLTVASPVRVPIVEVLLPLPPKIVLADGRNRLVLSLEAGEAVRRKIHLRAMACGRSKFGRVHMRLSTQSGLLVREEETDHRIEIEALPARVLVQHVPHSLRPRSSFGNYMSSRVGEGLEPGEIRPFVSGDRVRRINWRTSLRLGRLHVTRYQQEHNADVVLLLDTYVEAGGPMGTTLDATVRAAAALAARYLAKRDRVGVLELGGLRNWVRPASGRAHFEAVLQVLLSVDVAFTYVVRELDSIPPRMLPPRALVIAISPLRDERFTNAIKDLMARRAWDSSPDADLACRFWALERRFMLEDLRRTGLTVVEWDAASPLDGALLGMGRRKPAGTRL